MIRELKKTDVGFVLDTWLKSSKKLHHARFADQKSFNIGQGRVIESLFNHDRFIVACDQEDEDVIWGYIAYDPGTAIIDYIYVKELMRGHGIARNLIDATGLDGRIKVTHRPNTQGKDAYVRKFKKEFTYDPYSAFRVLVGPNDQEENS